MNTKVAQLVYDGNFEASRNIFLYVIFEKYLCKCFDNDERSEKSQAVNFDDHNIVSESRDFRCKYLSRTLEFSRGSCSKSEWARDRPARPPGSNLNQWACG